MNIHQLSILIVFLFFSGTLSAQTTWCGNHYADQLISNKKASSEESKKKLNEIRQNIQYQSNELLNKKNIALVFPVVIHIIHDSGVGDIDSLQIMDGLRIINEDFSRTNPDTGNTRAIFKPFAANVGLEFRLAKKDPQGNPTDGIVRVNSPLIPHPEPTDSAFDNVKALSQWPADRYYNIWLVRAIKDNAIGYAQYPGTEFTYGGPWETYGVVMRSDAWGTIGSSSSDGRTATHEIGHTLGLYHTFLSFSGGCGTVCDTTGDEVCDTPPCRPSNFCLTNGNTCSNDTSGSSPFAGNVPDPIENFMSYNTCQNMFSLGQSARMLGYINSFPELTNLVSPQNLHDTGVKEFPVGISNEKHTRQLLVYPNPADKKISFQLPALFHSHCMVRILSIDGRILTEENLETSQFQFINHVMDISDLNQGIYILRVSEGKSTYSMRFIAE